MSENDEPRVIAMLKATDIARTLAWYSAAGFEVRGAHPAGEPTWCEVAHGDTAVQFLAGETPWDGAPAFTGCLYLHPASVDAVYEQVRHRVEAGYGVEDRPWGARELVLRDPDGYFVTFTEPGPGATDG